MRKGEGKEGSEGGGSRRAEHTNKAVKWQQTKSKLKMGDERGYLEGHYS